jgi:hypothetical protein
MKTHKKQSRRKRAEKWADLGLRREESKSYESRKPLAKVLIVCDDKKSAVYYLKGLRKELKISESTVEIYGYAYDQKSLVEKTISLFMEKQRNNKRNGLTDDKPYDNVYCVFDQDASHKDDPHFLKYTEAKVLIKNTQLADGVIFKAITSVPCYEFWLLLHFKCTDQPFANTQQKSICDMVIKALKQEPEMSNYGKKDKKIFDKVKDRLPEAIKNAEFVAKSNQQMGSDNPSTLIYQLVECLDAMYRTKNKNKIITYCD